MIRNVGVGKKVAASVTDSRRDATAKVAEGVWLDHRRAIVNPEAGWMAVADLHFGYETNRRQRGELMPDWGMAACEAQLMALIMDHQPATLILAGDIMDGGGSIDETHALILRLRAQVRRLICLRGNHDRAALCRPMEFLPWHREGALVFQHGDRFAEVVAETRRDGDIHVVGHAHPAVNLRDGAGLRLKLPAMVRECLDHGIERWVLPAFSPWAAGGEYRSEGTRLATWVCAPGKVFEA